LSLAACLAGLARRPFSQLPVPEPHAPAFLFLTEILLSLFD
jgi:hypothetical protein